MAFKGQKRLKKLKICQAEMPELPAGKQKQTIGDCIQVRRGLRRNLVLRKT